MKNSKIEWCDSTWNPVTGCLHDCKYCYARRIAKRFGAHITNYNYELLHDVEAKWETTTYQEDGVTVESKRTCPYPFDFEPTLHRYKLDEPQGWKKPRTIFVCSMADLFGAWVPAHWIEEVFSACEKAPQHRYLFLTKNPGRYCDLERAGIMPHGDNFWFGATYDHSNWNKKTVSGRPTTFSINGNRVHDAGDWYFPNYPEKNRFVSFEPLLYDIGANIGSTGGEWHIIGAETGNRKGKSVCKKEWVYHIVEWSDAHGIPVFMKDSLIPIVGAENMRREFPWDRKED